MVCKWFWPTFYDFIEIVCFGIFSLLQCKNMATLSDPYLIPLIWALYGMRKIISLPLTHTHSEAFRRQQGWIPQHCHQENTNVQAGCEVWWWTWAQGHVEEGWQGDCTWLRGEVGVWHGEGLRTRSGIGVWVSHKELEYQDRTNGSRGWEWRIFFLM